MIKKKKTKVLMIALNLMMAMLAGCGNKQTSIPMNDKPTAAFETSAEETDSVAADSLSGDSSLYEGNGDEAVSAVEVGSKEETSMETNSQIALPEDIEVGSTVFFGAYEQDNNTSNGKEDIEWIVLAKESGKALVISKYALDVQEYHVSNAGITWETCSLREWLNDDFFHTAFSADEQEIIATSIVSADKNPESNTATIPGNATQDKIFLLSIAEAEGYFASSNERQCEPTAYGKAHTNYSITDQNGTCMWWLRSSGCHYQSCPAHVFCDGSVIYDGRDCFIPMGIRPAMQIILDYKAAADVLTEFTKPDRRVAEPGAEDFTYNYDAALGGVKITGYNGGDRLVRIPAEIDGDAVKQVALSYDGMITQIELPDSVTRVSFGNCTGLKKVILPDNLTDIGMNAFSGCTNLTEITIPDGVTTIDWDMFNGCTSLTEVTIPDSVTSINGCAFMECTSLTEIEIPDSVTSIGEGAFSGCTSLSKIEIPYGVTEIARYMFEGCTSLTEVTIPDSVTFIDGGAFERCTSLRTLILPDSVEEIRSDAFEKCDALTVIYKGQEYNYSSGTKWW